MRDHCDILAAGFARPAKTLNILRSVLVHAVQRGWAPLAEMSLPDGRRADIMAMLPDGGFAIIEIKSCAADFHADRKWPSYSGVTPTLASHG